MNTIIIHQNGIHQILTRSSFKKENLFIAIDFAVTSTKSNVRVDWVHEKNRHTQGDKEYLKLTK